jgi:hypothetical protein
VHIRDRNSGHTVILILRPDKSRSYTFSVLADASMKFRKVRSKAMLLLIENRIGEEQSTLGGNTLVIESGDNTFGKRKCERQKAISQP